MKKNKLLITNNITGRNSSNADAIAALSDQVLKLTKEIEMLKKRESHNI
jgi:hypothetical protein